MTATAEREMLAMAAIAYRGYNLVLPDGLKRSRLRRLMSEFIRDSPSVAGKWEIVWGPAAFSAVSPGLDDALMYAARSGSETAMLAVVIRGTNPISLTDWIFGDALVREQSKWPYGEADESVRISASTALGLYILQNLRWDPADAGESGEDPFSDLPRARLSPSFSEPAAAATIRANIASRRLDPLNLLGELGRPAASGFTLNPLAILKRWVSLSAHPRGTGLKAFLKDYVMMRSDTEIYVTGHSKGGALATALALWLADTRGAVEPPEEFWTEDPDLPIHAYTFAAPTAGNIAFARYAEQALRHHRVWNALDVVPAAFVANDLRNFLSRFSLDPVERPLWQRLIDATVSRTEAMDYAQVGPESAPLKVTSAPAMPFSLQLVHQHLDAYLEAMDLIGEMSAATLFAPAA